MPVMTEIDFHAFRIRYRAAFESCKSLVIKPDDRLTDHEREVLEALDEVHEALLAAFYSAALDGT
jgi:hypothetical protein